MLILCKLLLGFGVNDFFTFFTNIVTITHETIKIVRDVAKTLFWSYDDISKTLLKFNRKVFD